MSFMLVLLLQLRDNSSILHPLVELHVLHRLSELVNLLEENLDLLGHLSHVRWSVELNRDCHTHSRVKV